MNLTLNVDAIRDCLYRMVAVKQSPRVKVLESSGEVRVQIPYGLFLDLSPNSSVEDLYNAAVILWKDALGPEGHRVFPYIVSPMTANLCAEYGLPVRANCEDNRIRATWETRMGSITAEYLPTGGESARIRWSVWSFSDLEHAVVEEGNHGWQRWPRVRHFYMSSESVVDFFQAVVPVHVTGEQFVSPYTVFCECGSNGKFDLQFIGPRGTSGFSIAGDPGDAIWFVQYFYGQPEIIDAITEIEQSDDSSILRVPSFDIEIHCDGKDARRLMDLARG